MSFATKLKRAFGFRSADDPEDDDDELLAATDNNDNGAPRALNPVVATLADAGGSPAPAAAADHGNLPGDLFDELLALFNAWVPDFVGKCLSTDEQRRYIMASLSVKLQRRLAEATGGAADAGFTADERARMIDEIARLRDDNGKVAALRSGMEQARLSAERQKRALTDRVLDLQSRVDDLEAANEKLRLEAARAASAPAARQGADEETKALKQEVERLTRANEELEAKTRLSDAMINDLQAKASAARKEAEGLRADMKVVEEINAQLGQVEQLMARKDARIAELTEAVGAERAKLEKVVEERETMRRTIETNLYNQAHSEARLRKEIKQLEKKLAAAREPAADAPGKGSAAERHRRSARKISAIDESLDNTDWFDSTPPPGEGKAPQPDNPDFGYQAPPRRKEPDNDAQMLLF